MNNMQAAMPNVTSYPSGVNTPKCCVDGSIISFFHIYICYESILVNNIYIDLYVVTIENVLVLPGFIFIIRLNFLP